MLQMAQFYFILIVFTLLHSHFSQAGLNWAPLGNERQLRRLMYFCYVSFTKKKKKASHSRDGVFCLTHYYCGQIKLTNHFAHVSRVFQNT